MLMQPWNPALIKRRSSLHEPANPLGYEPSVALFQEKPLGRLGDGESETLDDGPRVVPGGDGDRVAAAGSGHGYATEGCGS
jgi:hypothetical protein